MARTRLCFAGLILLFSVAGAAADEPMPWSRHSIADLSGTNAQAASSPADSAQAVHPSRKALERLSEPLESESDEESQLARNRRIAEFGEYREVDEATVEERLEKTRTRVRIEEANMLLRREDTDGARQLLEEALEESRHDASRYELHSRLGSMAFRLQDYETAEHHMAAALSLMPDEPALASNLAAAQMTRGKLDEALETLKGIRIGMIDNRHLLFGIHFNLACLYSMMEREEDAIEHLLQAAEKDPPSALASLGDPQLDGIRDDLRFRDLQLVLESMLEPEQTVF